MTTNPRFEINCFTVQLENEKLQSLKGVIQQNLYFHFSVVKFGLQVVHFQLGRWCYFNFIGEEVLCRRYCPI